MNVFRSLWTFVWLCCGPLYFGGSKSSVSESKTSTSQADNRVVLGNGSTQVGAGGSYSTDSSVHNATSFDVSDSSSRDSHNVTTYTANDPHLDTIARSIAAANQAIAENQGDAVKTIAKFGSDAITTQAQAATDLYATGSAGLTQAWGHTVDKSSELIDHLLTAATSTVAGANNVATSAIASYQPTANAQAGTLKAGVIVAGAALLAVAFIVKHKG